MKTSPGTEEGEHNIAAFYQRLWLRMTGATRFLRSVAPARMSVRQSVPDARHGVSQMNDNPGTPESHFSDLGLPGKMGMNHDAGFGTQLPPPQPEDSNHCNWRIGDVAVVFTLGGCLAVVLMLPEYAFLTRQLSSLTTPPVGTVARMIIIQNVCLCLACFLWLRLCRKAEMRCLGLIAADWRRHALVGLKLGCCLWLLGEVVQMLSRVLIRMLAGERVFTWLNSFESSTMLLHRALVSLTPVGAFTLFALVGILAPIAEEVMFRGFAYPAFRNCLGLKWGLVASAAFFAFLHFSPLDFPALCIIGVVLAWLYEDTRTLVAPFTAHAINNIITLTIMYLWPNSWL